MKVLSLVFVLMTSSSFAAFNNPEKAAKDLCELEWQITDQSVLTDIPVPQIVGKEVRKFNNSGYSLADFSIDEADFFKISIEGAESFRKMNKEMTTPYSESRDFFEERMTPLCIKNVLEMLEKDN
ncbi:hypothetical protein [Pseudomonas graminis]